VLPGQRAVPGRRPSVAVSGITTVGAGNEVAAGEFKMPGGNSGIVAVNGPGKSAEWGDGGGSPGPFGALLRRDRDPDRPPAPVPRPRQMSKLMLVLAKLWPVLNHMITYSNKPEAGDGPLPGPGGMAENRQPFSPDARL
jgi:hypothetical protein